jgi:hypothetical protein
MNDEGCWWAAFFVLDLCNVEGHNVHEGNTENTKESLLIFYFLFNKLIRFFVFSTVIVTKVIRLPQMFVVTVVICCVLCDQCS